MKPLFRPSQSLACLPDNIPLSFLFELSLGIFSPFPIYRPHMEEKVQNALQWSSGRKFSNFTHQYIWLESCSVECYH